MSAGAVLSRTNNGNAIDFRPAGQRERVAPITIPDWVRILGRKHSGCQVAHIKDAQAAVALAAYRASLEEASFGMSKEYDKQIKDGVQLYITTWVIPPLLRALELLNTEDSSRE